MVLGGTRDLFNNEFKKRIVTGFFLVAALVVPLFYFDLGFFIVSSIIYLAAMIECTYLCRKKVLALFLGFLYISLSFIGVLFFVFIIPEYLIFINFNGINIAGNAALFNIFIIMWLGDSAGYVFGKLIGGPKIIPAISPNKTWSGTIGAIIFPLIVLGFLTQNISYTQSFIIIMISSSVVYGDLIESRLKRYLGIKNSGNILPGHGGVLDRFDGLIGVGFSLFILLIYLLVNR